MTRDELILQCKYYRGEIQSPFEELLLEHEINQDDRPVSERMKTKYVGLSEEEVERLGCAHWFWMYEEAWVNFHERGDSTIADLEEEGRRLLERGAIPEDDTPLSLKAIFFNRYEYWN